MREQNGRFFAEQSRQISAICSLRQFEKAGFDPSEPRDEQGRWAYEDASTSNLTPIAYPGNFHDFMLDDVLKALRAEGSVTIKEVRITSVSGVTARADALVRPVNSDPYLVEVKTGINPSLSANQFEVYPYVCLGNHAFSPDAKILGAGLSPGVPLPKMKVMLVYTAGSGQKVHFDDLCDFLKLRAR